MATILIIDDDCAVRTAIQTFLNYEGFAVIAAENAAAGVEAVRTEIVDVAVLDLFMPDVSGFEAIKMLRQWAPKLPIIAITGFLFRDLGAPGIDALTKAGELGAVVTLRKPFRPRELTSAIEKCLAVDQPWAHGFGTDHDQPAVGLAVVSQDLRYVRINAQMAKFNGIPVADHIGRPFPEIIPHVYKPLEEKVRHVLRSGRPVEAFTFIGETADAPGIERGWLEDFFPIELANGKLAGVAAMVREISVSRASKGHGGQTLATPEHLLESGKECLRMARAEQRTAVGLDKLGHDIRARAVKRLTQIQRLRRSEGR